MPKPQNDTRSALFALQCAPTDRGRCVALCLPLSWRGTMNRILNNFPVSLDKENEVRYRLGLPAIYPPLVPVPACPDCGSVHHARCNGNAGAVVVLAPGETVTTPRPRRYSRIDQMPVSMLARAIRDRQLAGPAPGVEGYSEVQL